MLLLVLVAYGVCIATPLFGFVARLPQQVLLASVTPSRDSFSMHAARMERARIRRADSAHTNRTITPTVATMNKFPEVPEIC